MGDKCSIFRHKCSMNTKCSVLGSYRTFLALSSVPGRLKTSRPSHRRLAGTTGWMTNPPKPDRSHALLYS